MKKNLSARRIFVGLLFLGFIICGESVHAQCLKVTIPNVAQNWMQNSTKAIRWTYDTTGNPGSGVKIELLKSGATNTIINYYATIGNNGVGSFHWTVPAAQANGNDYKIRITSATNPSCADTSDSAFAIYHKIKAVTSPSEGQVLSRNNSHNITWTLEGSYPNEETVDLTLVKMTEFGSSRMGYIARNIPINALSYNWTVGKLADGGWVTADGTTKYIVMVEFKDIEFKNYSGKFTIKSSFKFQPYDKKINP